MKKGFIVWLAITAPMVLSAKVNVHPYTADLLLGVLCTLFSLAAYDYAKNG